MPTTSDGGGGGYQNLRFPPSSPQIREKRQQVVSRREEMMEKWKARWERLCLCECSLEAGEPGGRAGPLLGVG